MTSVTELMIPFESRGEIAYAAAFIEWFGEESKRVYRWEPTRAYIRRVALKRKW